MILAGSFSAQIRTLPPIVLPSEDIRSSILFFERWP
jgi:hypothetical protein